MTDATISSPLTEQRSAITGLAPMVAIVFFGFLSVGIPLPALSLYVHDQLGFSGFTVGWVIGIQSLITIASRHKAGTIADHRGPKFAVLLGLPLAALSGLLYLGSDLLAAPIPALAVLALGRLLLGAAESLFVTGVMSWGIGRVGPARTGKVMSWQGIALYGALGVGAPLGLAAHSALGFLGVALLATACPLVALLIALAVPAGSALGGERVSFHHVLKLIWRPGAVLMLATVPFAAMAAFLPLDYAAKGWNGAGTAIALFGIAYIFIRLIGSGWTDRLGAIPVVSISLTVELAGQLLLWLAPTEWLATVGAGLTGAGFSLVFPVMGVAAARRMPADQRGRAVGNFMAFFDLAICLTGPLAGMATGAFGYPSAFLIGVLAVLGSFLLLRSVASPG
jgi:MFS family permease